MANKNLSLALGAMAGAVGLIAMIRLVGGAFTGAITSFAWIATLLAMIPWVVYCAWRARHGNLSARGAVIVLVLCLIGLSGVWLFTFGPVVALTCSLAAFAVIWVSDWPPRRARGDEAFVRIDDLQTDDRE